MKSILFVTLAIGALLFATMASVSAANSYIVLNVYKNGVPASGVSVFLDGIGPQNSQGYTNNQGIITIGTSPGSHTVYATNVLSLETWIGCASGNVPQLTSQRFVINLHKAPLGSLPGC
jgi:hypothetical protein